MNNSVPLSACHNAPVISVGMGDFHDHDEICTMHWECTTCEMPCDITPSEEPLDSSPSPTQGDAAGIANTAVDFSEGIENCETCLEEGFSGEGYCSQCGNYDSDFYRFWADDSINERISLAEDFARDMQGNPRFSSLQSQLQASEQNVKRLEGISLKASYEAGKVPELQQRVKELEKIITMTRVCPECHKILPLLYLP